MIEKLIGTDRDVRLAQIVNALAITLRQMAKYTEAEKLYMRALELRLVCSFQKKKL